MEAYQQMGSDEKSVPLPNITVSVPRAVVRLSGRTSEQRLAAQDVATEIEPLVNEPEPRSRRARKAKFENERSKPVSHVAASASGDIGADHPITKRKRVQRDLSQVIFGPTQ